MEKHDPKNIVEKVKGDYNLIAREWDLSRLRPTQLKLNLIRDIGEGETVLDVGCGNALMAPFLLGQGAYYTGVDIAENLTKIAGERYREAIESGRMRLLTGEATELPVKDGEYDAVISFAVLHHLPAALHGRFFEEVRRVLRPGGRAKLTVWNLWSEWAKRKFDTAAQLGDDPSGEIYIPWKGTAGVIVSRYVYQFSKEELESWAAKAGFSEISAGYFNRAGEEIDNGEELVLEMKG